MIKTTDTTEDPSTVFMNELNSNFKEAFLRFLEEVKEEKHKGRFDKQPSFFDSLLNKNAYSDIYINAYLNSEKLEFTFANDSFSEQRFPKDKHKCQQFHIVKLKPTSKYFRNLYYIYIGNDISEKTKEATLKTIYNKILKVHYELTTELLGLSNINSVDEGDVVFDYAINKSIFTNRFVSDDILYSLPDDFFKIIVENGYKDLSGAMIDRNFDLNNLYPKFISRLLDYRVDEICKIRTYTWLSSVDTNVIRDVIDELSPMDAHYITKLFLENMKNGNYINYNLPFGKNSNVLQNILESRVFTSPVDKDFDSLRNDIYGLATDIFISERETLDSVSLRQLISESNDECEHKIDIKKIVGSFEFIETSSLYELTRLKEEIKYCNNVKYFITDVYSFLIKKGCGFETFKDINSDIASGDYSIYVEEEERDMFVDCILSTFKLFAFKYKKNNQHISESNLEQKLVEYTNIINTFTENIKCK